MVSTKSGKSIADKFGAYFYECSAKTGVRVEEAFMTVAAKVRISRRATLSPLVAVCIWIASLSVMDAWSFY